MTKRGDVYCIFAVLFIFKSTPPHDCSGRKQFPYDRLYMRICSALVCARSMQFTEPPGMGDSKRTHACFGDWYVGLQYAVQAFSMRLLLGIPSLTAEQRSGLVVALGHLCRESEEWTSGAAADPNWCDRLHVGFCLRYLGEVAVLSSQPVGSAWVCGACGLSIVVAKYTCQDAACGAVLCVCCQEHHDPSHELLQKKSVRGSSAARAQPSTASVWHEEEEAWARCILKHDVKGGRYRFQVNWRGRDKKHTYEYRESLGNDNLILEYVKGRPTLRENIERAGGELRYDASKEALCSDGEEGEGGGEGDGDEGDEGDEGRDEEEGEVRLSVVNARFQELLRQHNVSFSNRSKYFELYEQARQAEPLPTRRAIPACAVEQVSGQ